VDAGREEKAKDSRNGLDVYIGLLYWLVNVPKHFRSLAAFGCFQCVGLLF
jgi:hypothetical protein